MYSDIDNENGGIMITSRKLQKWVEKGLISQDQADNISSYENSNNSTIVLKWLYGIAGLFIGLGVILLIGANWDVIPSVVKLFGDFVLWGGVLYGTYWSFINKKEKLKELFLLLSFLFIGATIGLIAQIFNLDGGWSSFALMWALLGLPFVLFTRLLFFNFCWWCLLFSLFDYKVYEYFCETLGVISGVILLSLLSYLSKKLDEKVNRYTLLPKALQNLSMFMAYVVIFLNLNFSPETIFIFLFFALRMFLAVKAQNMLSFKRNAIAGEIYIFLVFIFLFKDLFLSGIGFIVAGLVVLALIYLLKTTSKYIKTMEVFRG